MAASSYPTYTTAKGTPVTAYYAECIGMSAVVDDTPWTGKNGTIGAYVTAEEAIERAKAEKDSTCTVRVTNTRATNGPEAIFEL